MKTGRRRKKEETQDADKLPPKAPDAKPVSFSPPSGAPDRTPTRPSTARTPARSSTARLLPILIGLVVLAFGGVICSRSCLGPKTEPVTYLPATAEGSWTTTVNVLASEGMGESAERVVDDYDEYAYNIYYEETEEKLYEAADDSFTVTQLNADENWWEGERHYYSEEWLDKETCQYTNYTVWITDPEDTDYEIEVVLSECEVWDHVVVKERVSEAAGSPAIPGTLTRQGVGSAVEWPQAVAPANADIEREFEGTVIFRADGAERTVTTTDVDKYIYYVTVPHYLGLDEGGKVVRLTDKAP
jgi:hypothetical protein